MKTIYKYLLKLKVKQIIKLPKGSRPLRAEYQDDNLMVWVFIPDTDLIEEDYTFYIVGTGWEIQFDNEPEYLSTVFKPGLVLHIFYDFNIL